MSQRDLMRRFREHCGARFSSLRFLGRGGMGLVLYAEDRQLERPVAIKLLLSHLADDPTLRHRFEREVAALGRVDHPHVVRMYDVGNLDGLPFVVMSYVEGTTLRQLIKAEPDNPAWMVNVAADVADGLAALHASGVVHRDLKPENVIVDREGRGVLMDFGLVRFADEATMTALTKSGQVVGTLRYLPPEILAGFRSDSRADIYQLGLILYECLTGTHPFAVADLRRLIKVVSEKDVEPPMGPGVDEELSDFVMTCIDADPELRPSDARQVRDKLRTWARLAKVRGIRATTSSEGSSATRRSPRPTAESSVQPSIKPAVEPRLDTQFYLLWAGRRRLVGAGLIVVILLIVVMFLRMGLGPIEWRGRAGPTADGEDVIGWRTLHHTAWNGQEQEVHQIIDAEGGLSARDDAGWTPLHVAAWAANEEAVRALLSAGAAVDSPDYLGRTPLAWAAYVGGGEVTAMLIEGGASLVGADIYGRTPLHFAVLGQQGNALTELLGRGADPHVSDLWGQTPLHLAVGIGRRDFVDLLLVSGAQTLVKDGRGRTPLMTALVTGRADMAEFLLDSGADPLQADYLGSTPLHEAAAREFMPVIRRLLADGALTDTTDHQGYTPYDQARRRGRRRAMHLLSSQP